MSGYDCAIWAFCGVLGGFLVGLALRCHEEPSNGNGVKVFVVSLGFIVYGNLLLLFQPLLVFCSSRIRQNLIRFLIKAAEKEHGISLSDSDRKSLEVVLLETVPHLTLCRAAFGLMRAFCHDFGAVYNLVPSEVAKLMKLSTQKSVAERSVTIHCVRDNVASRYRLPSFYGRSTLAHLCL